MVSAVVGLETRLVESLVTSTKIVLIVEYDGTRYYGFQLQANLPTVQRELEVALEKLTGEKRRVMAASRTDTGVHARGQVISFRTGSSLPLSAFVNGINYYLPEDIAVKAASRVSDSCDVRRGAVSREYNYYILNKLPRSPLRRGYSYRVGGHLDIEAMDQACQALIGEKDYSSFVTGEEDETKSTVRRISRAEVVRDDDLVVFQVVANSFLRHQVRNTVGTLIRVGLGKMTVDEFYSLVEAKRPSLAGPTAPACGLCLIRVNYPGPLGEDTWGDI
ncbi:tRNA pseudouridine(38-40) synthase TruA [Chloroflexota bacterium]